MSEVPRDRERKAEKSEIWRQRGRGGKQTLEERRYYGLYPFLDYFFPLLTILSGFLGNNPPSAPVASQ